MTRRILLLLVPVLVAALAAAPIAIGAPPPVRADTLVLPTGERVDVTSAVDHARVTQHVGSPPVQIVRVGARTVLLPREALPHLGQLDLRLFDTAQLVAHAARIPVVITGSADSVPGVTITSRSGSTARGYITPASAPRFGTAVRDGLPGVTRIALDAAPPVTPAFPQVTLDIKILSPAGVHPVATLLLIANTDDGRKANLVYGLDGNDQKVSVPKGHYSLIALTITESGEKDIVARYGFTTGINVSTDDQYTVVDTRGATRDAFPTFITPRPTRLEWRDLAYTITDAHGVFATGIDNPDFDGTARILAPAVQSRGPGGLSSVAYASLPATTGTDRYWLATGHADKVVPAERVAPSASSLAAVQVHAYTDGRRLDAVGGRYATYPYFDPGGFIVSDLPDAAVRTDYLATGGGLSWLANIGQYAADGSSARSVIGLPRAFPAGRTTREDFFRGPLGPGLVAQPGLGFPDCQACRSASQLLLGVAPITDSDPQHVGELFSVDPPELTVTVRRDGATVFTSPEVIYAIHGAVVDVPAGDHGYDIVAVHDGTVVGQRQSTYARTEWKFRSSATSGRPAPSGWTCNGSDSCTVLPVLTLSDPLPTTSRGALPPGTAQVVVTATGVVGSGIVAKALSYEVGVDGRALVPQAVRALGGGRFLVTVRTPAAAAGTGITVHVHAIDAAGGSIDQNVRTAYVVGSSS